VSVPAWFRRLQPHGLRAVLIAAALAMLPALVTPFVVDDWYHLANVRGDGLLPDRAPWDLFHFDNSGDPFPGGVQGNYLPWWTGGEFRGRFLRPLSSVLHWVEYAVFGLNPLPAHAISFAAWLGLVGAFWRLGRRLALRSAHAAVPLLAALIFAVDESHAWPVAWVANRNALLSTMFVVLALERHVAWRDRAGPMWAAPLLLGLGLLCGEMAIGGVAFVLAWELVVTDGTVRERARAAAPAVFVGVGYLLAWKALGYGTAGSGMYLNPLADPVAFVGWALPTRMPAMLATALLQAPLESTMLLTDGQQGVLGLLCALAVAPALVLLLPTLRRDRLARFAVLGAVLAMVPCAATMPAGRVLVLASVGVAWVLATVVAEAWAGLAPRALGAVVVAVHLGLSVVSGWAAVGAFQWIALSTSGHIDAAELPPPDPDARVLLVNSPTPFLPLYLRIQRGVAEGVQHAAVWPVSAVPSDLEFVRTGDGTFTLATSAPGFLTTPFERLVRSEDSYEAGVEGVSGGLRVRSDLVVDGESHRLEATIDRSRDDPSVTLLAWDGEAMRPWAPPPVGGCAAIPFVMEHAFYKPFNRPPVPGLCASEHSQRVAAAARVVGARTEPVVAEPGGADAATCSLELNLGQGWAPRAELPCPGPEGTGVIVAGDVGFAGELLTESVDGMIRFCGERPCHLMLLPGDLLYGPGSVADKMWSLVWDASLARVGVPGLGSLGNHEYRHEPEPKLKREALAAADGRAGFVLPQSAYAARIRRGEQTLVAFAALDSDSVANPGPGMPGLGTWALEQACGEGAPTVAVAKVLRERKAAGCELVFAASGHDHDLQAWPPSCQRDGDVAVLVSGASARGFRKQGSAHLEPCPATPATGRYHADRPGGGFVHATIAPDGGVSVTLQATHNGELTELSSTKW
jgi:hypothetical protein